MYLALSAGMVALVALVCYGGVALSVRAWHEAHGQQPHRARARQLAGPAAGWLLILSIFVAVRVPLAGSSYAGGGFGSVLLARSLFARDVLPGVAIAAALMAAAMGAVVAHHARRDRS